MAPNGRPKSQGNTLYSRVTYSQINMEREDGRAAPAGGEENNRSDDCQTFRAGEWAGGGATSNKRFPSVAAGEWEGLEWVGGIKCAHLPL